MGRVSQAQAQENRQRVVETASRLFREQGTHVSVADLMKAAGLTHGGFYKQFASKDALVDEATAHAFDELARLHTAGIERHAGQHDAAQREVIDTYLSVEHRDNAADGCPVAGLAADMARADGNDEAHRVYAEGVRAFAEALATEDQDGITRLCTMLGALVLARATKDSPLSEEILTTARAALTESG
ncbi:TetR family transcriptional regulator [Streptomyces dangxiongensis]|uniref:TetR family transcriptional regulator n=1 Tax=Streptomyces dangxiongensis TaxID=1442032 RepID=A0A3G2JC55_9ACTN|nr:TetR family transcriptional regulator [Streptomyces dangxiongensis]AYN38112.1 TetR family transcriptional regulator [Streptomyces dangxiongensis]